jgi:hypothetical protein
VSAVLPGDVAQRGKAKIGLVRERGRAQRVTGTFAAQRPRREAAELAVDDWQQ